MTVEVSLFFNIFCLNSSFDNVFEVSGCLFHIVMATSLERLNELPSAIFNDHNVLFSDGIVLPLNVILRDINVVFVILSFLIILVAFPQ